MSIDSDFPLIVNHKALLAIQGDNFSKLLQRHPAIARKFETILSDLPTLYHPQLVWDRFAIKNISGDNFELTNGHQIGGGPVIQVMKEATSVILGMCTIGMAMDQKIDQFNHDDDLMSAVLLDGVASYLVDQVRETFFQRITSSLTEQGLYTSIPLCPGESAWEITDHTIFFELLNPAQIGMTLKTSMLMIPMKSLSFMIGVSEEKFSLTGVQRCDFCSMQYKCRHAQKESGQKLCH